MTSPSEPPQNPPRAQGPEAKGAARRVELIAAVLEAISERGFEASTLKELAKRVGTSEANILHHFGTKQRLLLEAIRQHDDEDIADLTHLSPAVIATIIRRHASTPGLVELLLNMTVASASPSSATHSFFRDRYARLRGAGGPAFENGVATPDGTVLPPDWVARILLAAADGLQIQWLLDPEIDMAADMERLSSLFVALSIGSEPATDDEE